MDIFINKEVFTPVDFIKSKDQVILGKTVYKLVKRKDNEIIISKNGKNLNAYYSFNHKTQEYSISLSGRVYKVKLGQGGHGELSTQSSNVIISPMPGKIFKVLKTVGQDVKKGETVLILEAMKMEHSLKAKTDGKIKTLKGRVGDQVSADQLLVEIEELQS